MQKSIEDRNTRMLQLIETTENENEIINKVDKTLNEEADLIFNRKNYKNQLVVYLQLQMKVS